MILRLARTGEAELCYRYIEEAKAYQRSLGFVQWHEDYPTLEMLRKDIVDRIGYVFAENDEILGYCCITEGQEPAYQKIDGAWKTARPYAAIHRMAFGDHARGRGLSHAAFRLLRAHCEERQLSAIRIDTMEENGPMRHVLEREGFVYCGRVENDGPRLAYEWDW